MKPLIIGIDPGTTVALAFLDVHGKFLGAESTKNASVEDTIAAISNKGNPIIIASDRSPIPEAVARIASSFRCRVFAEQLGVAEKKELVKNFPSLNNHEKDALAAALKAFAGFSAKLRNIEKRYPGDFESRVKEALLGGKPLPEEPKVVVQREIQYVHKAPEEYAAKIADGEQALSRLKADVENQRNIIRMQQIRIEELELRPRKMAGKEIVVAKEKNIQSLASKERVLERALTELAEAVAKSNVVVLDLSKVVFTEQNTKTDKPLYTSRSEVFEWCKRNNQACTFVKELYRAPSYALAQELDHCEPEAKLDDILEEYRRKRQKI